MAAERLVMTSEGRAGGGEGGEFLEEGLEQLLALSPLQCPLQEQPERCTHLLLSERAQMARRHRPAHPQQQQEQEAEQHRHDTGAFVALECAQMPG